MPRILVVDDEPSIVELVKFNLEKEGHEVAALYDGVSAIEGAINFKPDLIILDLMLPGRDGLDVFRNLQTMEATAGIPVIMLSAKGGEFDKVLGLEMGADDYITKPFSPRELAARVKACLRRRGTRNTWSEDLRELRVGPLLIKPDHHQVFLNGQLLELSPKEFELLKILVVNKGKVLKRDFLLDRIWGYDYVTDSRTVDVHIRYLRQKIEQDPAHPDLIETVRGVGYRLKELS
ncbi:MAG: winged helix-turn-helix domain-containing protein [Bacillota bacterium]